MGGVDATPLRFFKDSVKTAARSAAMFGTADGATFFTCDLKISGLGDLGLGHQVRKTGTRSWSNFNFLYAPVQLIVLDRFPSNLQDVLSSPSCITYSSFLCH